MGCGVLPMKLFSSCWGADAAAAGGGGGASADAGGSGAVGCGLCCAPSVADADRAACNAHLAARSKFAQLTFRNDTP